MTDLIKRDLLLTDPLSEVTRKERRMLLAVSVLAVTIVKTGLVPTKIAALGVEFDKTNQQALLVLLAIITAYFLVAFIIYASADYIIWQRAADRARAELIKEDQHRKQNAKINLRTGFLQDQEQRIARSDEKIFFGSVFQNPVVVLRVVFEFLLPVIVGLVSVFFVWFAANKI